MSDIAIKVEGLGKRYRLGGPKERYATLRDQLSRLCSPSKLFARRPPRADTTFWALKDISFDVNVGEVVGIIGRNGAGKSTLLKILSRITEPTEGGADIRGRVGSLLEVGTGFHPELTGRENIFLNGAILGMKRSETMRKFDAIVEFAEMDRFIDTPVKHYSSGMYMRLAFAVAAHLEPEVLVVDEVLAVGDAQFQRKCLGKMGEVAKGGRTVLFVSHAMAAVQSLCSRAILLAGGKVIRMGPTGDVISEYLAAASRRGFDASRPRPVDSSLSLADVRFEPSVFRAEGPTTVSVTLAAAANALVTDLCVLIDSPMGVRVAIVDLRSPDGPYRISAGSRLTVEADLPCVRLVEGEYIVGLYVVSGEFTGEMRDLTTIDVNARETPPSVPQYPPVARGFAELEVGPVRAVLRSLVEKT